MNQALPQWVPQVERSFAPLLSSGSEDLAVAAVLDADAGSAGAGAAVAQLKTLRAHGRLKSLGKGRAGENGISLDIYIIYI